MINKHRLTLTAAFAILLLLPALANATPVAIYSLNGTTWFDITLTSVPGSWHAYNFTADGWTVNDLAILSNSPGLPTLAKLLNSDLNVSYAGTGGASTIYFAIGDNGFTQPATPPSPGLRFDSSIGGTDVVPVAGGQAGESITLQSYAVPSNVEPTTGTPTPSPNFTTGLETVNLKGLTSFNDSAAPISIVGGLPAPYALSQYITVTLLPGDSLNFTTNSTLTPVPEPGTLLLLGFGLASVGVMIRKRSK